MATYRFTSNVATKVAVRYLDAVAGQYGPQMRINGTFTTEGAEPEKAYAYLPGDIIDVCNELLRAGVLKDVPEVYPEEGGKAISVKIARKEFVVVADQPAGQKHQSTRIVTKPVAAAAHPSQQPAAAAPQSGPYAVPRGGAVASALPQQRQAAIATYDNPLYLSIADFVLAQMPARFAAGGVSVSPEALAACINSLWIHESRNGAGRA